MSFYFLITFLLKIILYKIYYYILKIDNLFSKNSNINLLRCNRLTHSITINYVNNN